MTRRRGGGGGGEERREGFYWDVSQYIIVHRANRQPVTRTGWGFLFTGWSILVWLPGGALWPVPQHKMLVVMS